MFPESSHILLTRKNALLLLNNNRAVGGSPAGQAMARPLLTIRVEATMVHYNVLTHIFLIKEHLILFVHSWESCLVLATLGYIHAFQVSL